MQIFLFLIYCLNQILIAFKKKIEKDQQVSISIFTLNEDEYI